ncbi:MAG: HpcH/HpaI aldolase/citrate lyase family protein [Rhizobiaceae bacterium]
MRSSLFVPGDSERKLAKGLESGADALFIDLEDSVALDSKQAAREITSSFLKDVVRNETRPALYVRINAFDTDMTANDLKAAMAGRPDGIVLPKSEHGQDVTRLDSDLGIHEAENGIEDGATYIIAIITETAIGTLNAGTYRRSSKRLTAVSWGAEDLSADVGALRRRRDDGTYTDIFRFARTQTLLGAIGAGVQPLDTVYPDFRNETGFRRECEEAMLDGFTGKMAIHPAQVPIINEVFTPSDSEVAKAQAVIDAFEAAGNPGVLAVDGEMLDRPHLRKAQNLLARAQQKTAAVVSGGSIHPES